MQRSWLKANRFKEMTFPQIFCLYSLYKHVRHWYWVCLELVKNFLLFVSWPVLQVCQPVCFCVISLSLSLSLSLFICVSLSFSVSPPPPPCLTHFRFHSFRDCVYPGHPLWDREAHDSLRIGHLALWLLHLRSAAECGGHLEIQILLQRPCSGLLLHRWRFSITSSSVMKRYSVLQMLEMWLSEERLLSNSPPRFLTDDEESREQPSSVRQCYRLLLVWFLGPIINTSVFSEFSSKKLFIIQSFKSTMHSISFSIWCVSPGREEI